jgi:hypothetical protein
MSQIEFNELSLCEVLRLNRDLLSKQNGVNTLIVIILRFSHVTKQQPWWKSQAHSILWGSIVIEEVTLFFNKYDEMLIAHSVSRLENPHELNKLYLN